MKNNKEEIYNALLILKDNCDPGLGCQDCPCCYDGDCKVIDSIPKEWNIVKEKSGCKEYYLK